LFLQFFQLQIEYDMISMKVLIGMGYVLEGMFWNKYQKDEVP